MYETGRSFDGWDIVFFVVGTFGAALTLGLTSSHHLSYRFSFVGGAAGLLLRNAVLPRQRAVVPLSAPVTSGRSLMGAVCLGIGIVLSALGAIALLIAICATINERNAVGLIAVAVCALPLAAGIALVRFGFRADRGS